MKPETTLERINSEEHVNETISRDEETQSSDEAAGLKMAEELILQLPESHNGRTQWLITYGRSSEAAKLKNGS